MLLTLDLGCHPCGCRFVVLQCEPFISEPFLSTSLRGQEFEYGSLLNHDMLDNWQFGSMLSEPPVEEAHGSFERKEDRTPKAEG